jgi:hypothetical protein
MTRKAGLFLGAVLVICSACSGTESTTTSAGTSTTTSSTPNATSKPTNKPTITKPATVEKVDKAKLPAKAQAAPTYFELTQDESDCIDTIVLNVYTTTPGFPTDDATVAGIAGASIVQCVPQDKIANAVVADLKADPGGAGLTDTQLDCIRTEINAADKDSLASFVAAVAYGQDILLKPFRDALAKACSITST